jgi:predicted negative regulator of RcsB-dependent stress response
MLRSGEKRRLLMAFPVFEYLWKDSGYWAMAVVPGNRVPVTVHEDTWLAAIAAMDRVADRPAARTAYSTFLQRWPDSLIGAIGLANVEYAAGDLVAAEAVLRTAVRRHPDSALALNNLAQVVVDRERPGEALELIDQAIALGGAFAAQAQDTRTQILHRLQGGKP